LCFPTQLAGPQRGGNLLGRGLHVVQVGIAAIRKGRGNANEQTVGLGHALHIGRGDKLLGLDAIGNPFGRDMADVAFAGQKFFHLGGIYVKAHGAIAGGDKRADQRQAHVAQSNHANDRFFIANRLFQVVRHNKISCANDEDKFVEF
jgi:hypothetical protein